jgi:AcrR family transcriptional regulator
MTRRAGITRASLVEEAVRLIDEAGFDQLALAPLARRLGVRPPSLFEHVEGTADLVRAVRLRGFQEQATLLRKSATGRSGGDAVRAMALAYRNFALAHPGLYTATIRTIERDTPEVRAAGDEALTCVADVLRGYGIEGPEAVHAARYLRSVIHGFLLLETASGFGLDVDVDESYERAIDAVVDNLSTWKARDSLVKRGKVKRSSPTHRRGPSTRWQSRRLREIPKGGARSVIQPR